MGSHNPRVANSSQAPASGDPIHLTLRALPIRTRCDDRCICATFDMAQNRVITPIKHFLHFAAHRRKVLRAHKNVCRCRQDIFGEYGGCPGQAAQFSCTGRDIASQGLAGTSPAMPDDKEMRSSHGADCQTFRCGKSIASTVRSPLPRVISPNGIAIPQPCSWRSTFPFRQSLALARRKHGNRSC